MSGVEEGGSDAARGVCRANGAGKTTHAEPILRTLGIATFVNADYIARGLSGIDTDAVAFEAGRVMLRRLEQLLRARADFAFESTLASRSFVRSLTNLFSLYLPLADEWSVFDNSAVGESRLVAMHNGTDTIVHAPRTWQRLQRRARRATNRR